MWKSRQDKLPPPSYFSMIVAHLQKAYQDARISRELMETLQPYFVEAWRNGKTAEAAAQTTCSCHRGEVVPSPVVGVRVVKGSVRPPKDAQRGEVFGAEALRPPAAVERLTRRMRRLDTQQAKQEEVTSRWEKRAQSARKETTQREAKQKQAASVTKREVMLIEARRIETEIKRLQGDLNRPVYKQLNGLHADSSAPSRKAELPQPSMSAPRGKAEPPQSSMSDARVIAASSSATPERQKSGRPARKKAAAATASIAPPATPTSIGAASEEGEAMLRAIRGIMPELAGQIASEMVKERSAK